VGPTIRLRCPSCGTTNDLEARPIVTRPEDPQLVGGPCPACGSQIASSRDADVSSIESYYRGIDRDN